MRGLSDCIEITNNGELLSAYDKDSEEYLAVYNALNANWWKNDPVEAYSMADEALTEVENIKTTHRKQ